MELSERINVLTQAAELAQKNGILKLDDAVIAKQSIDSIKNGSHIKEGLMNLKKIAEVCQKHGVFTLRDAYFVFIACDGIENLQSTNTPPTQQKGNEE